MATSYNKLFKLLIDRNMMKRELGEAAGISKATMAKLKTGKSITSQNLESICRVLGVDYGDIMEYIPDKPNGGNGTQ